MVFLRDTDALIQVNACRNHRWYDTPMVEAVSITPPVPTGLEAAGPVNPAPPAPGAAAAAPRTPLNLGLAAFASGNMQAATLTLQPLARAGSPTATYYLGLIAEFFTPRADPATVARLYRK
jgi:hypothetical protein